MRIQLLTALCGLITTASCALTLDLNSPASVNNAVALVAQGMLDYYDGFRFGGTIGMFVQPYYWWHAGAAWNALIEYWHITGNASLNDITYEAMMHQRGERYDLMVFNFSSSEGNDDQGVWGMTMMTAAERNFTAPSDEYGWLYVAQGAFNTMAARWDDICGGGLHWQIFQWNSGYSYKNAIANGALFNIGARLYRYTGNETYLEWCDRIWDWAEAVDLVTSKYEVYDGIQTGSENVPNCTNRTPYIWTYNSGIFMHGAAALYNGTLLRNGTGSEKWGKRVKGIFQTAISPLHFFGGPQDNIMREIACQQKTITCDADQRTFKGIYSSLLGQTAQLVPDLAPQIMKYLVPSAQAAVRTCSGGRDGHTCSLDWLTGTYDVNYIGLGEQLSVLGVILNTQIMKSAGPLADITGGESKGNGSAGAVYESPFANTIAAPLVIGPGDRAGAGIITAVVGIVLLGTGWWLLTDGQYKGWKIKRRGVVEE